jgi:hypothetical protein
VIEGLRSLILDGFVLSKLLECVGVIVGAGAMLTALSLRALQAYGRD